ARAAAADDPRRRRQDAENVRGFEHALGAAQIEDAEALMPAVNGERAGAEQNDRGWRVRQIGDGEWLEAADERAAQHPWHDAHARRRIAKNDGREEHARAPRAARKAPKKRG